MHIIKFQLLHTWRANFATLKSACMIRDGSSDVYPWMMPTRRFPHALPARSLVPTDAGGQAWD